VPTRFKSPALAVDAVWVRRGRVLLVRRGRYPFRGSLAFPGGFVEPDETVEQALVRELEEETGLKGRPAGIVGVYSGPDRDPRKPTTTIAYFVRGRGGIPLGADDAASAAWVPLEEARPLAFDHGRILADALRLRRRSRRAPRRRSVRE